MNGSASCNESSADFKSRAKTSCNCIRLTAGSFTIGIKRKVLLNSLQAEEAVEQLQCSKSLNHCE